MKVLFNHIGYAPADEKRLLLEAPESAQWSMVALVDVLKGEDVWRGLPTFCGRVEGWSVGPWWSVDLTDVQAEGRYALRWALAGGASGQSEGFSIDSEILGTAVVSDLLFHIKSQRSSGIWERADAQAPRVGDEKRRDVSGGWFDASGDNSKYLSHLSYANVMNPQQNPLVAWVLARSWQGYAAAEMHSYLAERLRDEALHGADWLMRMQDEAGFWYMTVFDRWSKDPAQRELCSYRTQAGEKGQDYQAGWRQGGGMAIAALALASSLGAGGMYSADDYLAAARRGFEHLCEHGLGYLDDGRENLIDETCALLAAAELAVRLPEDAFVASELSRRWRCLLERRRETADHVWLAMDEAGERSWFHASDAGLPAIVLQRAAALHPTNALATPGLRLAKAWLTSIDELSHEVANPFGYPAHWVKTGDDPGKRQWFYPHDNPSGYWWQGENAKLASLAGAVEGLSAAGGDLERAARRWIDWVFGANPFDCCMMQGHGRNNPAYEAGFFNAPGGVCNGITSGFTDEADIAFQPLPYNNSGAQRWRWGEQWLPHAAWLLYALALRDTKK